jgi:hypothetical protein
MQGFFREGNVTFNAAEAQACTPCGKGLTTASEGSVQQSRELMLWRLPGRDPPKLAVS